MEAEIKTFIKNKKGEDQLISLFGYSTNGLPGFEIVGLGTFGKNLKEKLIYLTRQRKLSIPLKRFVVSLDTNFDAKEFTWESLAVVEFPIMVLYWHLSGLMPLKSVHHVMAGGAILGSGKILLSRFTPAKNYDEYVLITLERSSWKRTIHPEDLFQHIPELSFL